MVDVHLQRTEWYVAFHSLKHSFGKFLWIVIFQADQPEICLYAPKCCTLTVHGSHMAIQIPPHSTQYLTQNDQNSTRKSLHVSDNIVYSKICHKCIHIMGGKHQTSKEIATCQNFSSPRICCEQAACSHFLFILWHYNPTAHTVTCTVHVQCTGHVQLHRLQKTAWKVTFEYFKDFCSNLDIRSWIFLFFKYKFYTDSCSNTCCFNLYGNVYGTKGVKRVW